MKKLKYFKTEEFIIFSKFLFIIKVIIGITILTIMIMLAIDLANHIEAVGLKNILLPLWEGKS